METGKSAQARSKKAKDPVPIPTFGLPFVDTHAHIDMILQNRNIDVNNFQKFKEDEFSKDFIGCVNVCCFKDSFDPCEKLQEDFGTTGAIFSSYGVHPHEASLYNDELEKRIIANMTKKTTVAWGECGLDYFKHFSPADVQREVFVRQMKNAINVNKPLIVHSRDAEDDTFDLMSKTLPADYIIHLHCFTGTTEFALKMINHFPNLYIGFTGCITFKSASKTREVVAALPLDRLLLETDGPFMAPEPHRGVPAHPGMIPLVAKCIAEIKNVSVEEVLKQTTLNAHRVYLCFS